MSVERILLSNLQQQLPSELQDIGFQVGHNGLPSWIWSCVTSAPPQLTPLCLLLCCHRSTQAGVPPALGMALHIVAAFRSFHLRFYAMAQMA